MVKTRTSEETRRAGLRSGGGASSASMDTEGTNANASGKRSPRYGQRSPRAPMVPASNIKDHLEADKVWSFAACGWLKIYYFGVCKALREAGLDDGAKFVGSSAGSLVSLAMALELDFEKIRDYQLSCVKRTHGSLFGAFKLREYITGIMDMMLPENAVQKIGDKVEVSISVMPLMTNRRVRHFRDDEHLRNCIYASCCMAPFAGMPFKLDGEWIYDGAASDWIRKGFFTSPVGHGGTNATCLTVTPFWFSRADIRPSQYLPLWWAVYPPRVEDFEWVFHLGYKDAQAYVDRLKKAKCRPEKLPPLYKEVKWDIPGKPSGAFTRAFGYRSIFYLLPCSFLDFFLLVMLYMVLKPIAIFFVYLELLVRGFLHRCQQQRQSSRKNFMNPKLLYRTVAPTTWGQNIDSEELYASSLTYRVCSHFI
mmetsp:Transcript_27116/g.42418  ORF Transcript_27116/g.42418 Transcript_27116/m.42418 type:complete len:422 (-) Transcript_27116:2416-3681(-)|eukprot:CAMPEP_0184290712 /NCGR_PEP_ID=MMETSP1049-20130417/2878_1 /TAXON_ID=77928 /ORGANISM="Proteomonas sulcata, Strain CCMP704" /LENGTH=421 /DNA_ID=CAMNT_0026597929 /DNA_START=321 /DNA_END=1586 /DNA_ORIENTATION=-